MSLFFDVNLIMEDALRDGASGGWSLADAAGLSYEQSKNGEPMEAVLRG